MEEVKDEDLDLAMHPKSRGVSKQLDHKVVGSLAKTLANDIWTQSKKW